MRQDFNKLLTERERIGHSTKYHDVRGGKMNRIFDEDAKGGKVSIHAGRRNSKKVNRKSFNENLNPLRYFIADNVGRPWNKVFSELNEVFDRRKVVNNHIFEHLFQYVEINARMHDGKVCVLNSYRGNRRWDSELKKYVEYEEGYYDARWTPIKEDTCEWYVHPVDGLLKENKNRKTNRQIKIQREKEQEAANHKVFRKLNDHEELHFEDGLWYLFTLKRRPLPYYKDGADGLSDRQFAALSDADKKLVGKKILVTQRVEEYSPQKNLGYAGNHHRVRDTLYYASKEVANKRILKANNIDGTATFDEDHQPRSHRELAKYRKAA